MPIGKNQLTLKFVYSFYYKLKIAEKISINEKFDYNYF